MQKFRKDFRRSLTVLLCLLTFSTQSFALDPCVQNLLTPGQMRSYIIEELNANIDQSSTWLRTATFKLFKRKMIRNIQTECVAHNYCTVREVTEVVRKSIIEMETLHERNQVALARVKGIAQITASIVGAAIVSATLKGIIPESSEFIRTFGTMLDKPIEFLPKDSAVAQAVLPAVTFVFITALFSPFTDTLNAMIRKKSYSSTKGVAKAINPVNNNHLKGIFESSHSKLSVNEQHSRGILNPFESRVMTNLKDMHEFMTRPNPAEFERGVARLSDLVVVNRMIFQEISPDNPEVTRVVRDWFTNPFKSVENNEQIRKNLLDRTLNYIKTNNAEAASNSSLMIQYERTLRLWLDL